MKKTVILAAVGLCLIGATGAMAKQKITLPAIVSEPSRVVQSQPQAPEPQQTNQNQQDTVAADRIRSLEAHNRELEEQMKLNSEAQSQQIEELQAEKDKLVNDVEEQHSKYLREKNRRRKNNNSDW